VKAVAAAAEAIAGSEALALACHVGPDGDALGSMLGLGLAARAAGKKVVASFGSPFAVPGNLEFLPTDLLVPPSEFPGAPGVMAVLDAGSADRLGELAVNAGRASKLIVIDHHITNKGFGDIAVVNPEVAATAELVVEILERLGWPVTKDIATCLLTAVVTDTGRFQYANTRPETLRTAADLVAAGAEPAEIARHVYEEAPFGYLKAAGTALSRAVLEPDLSLVTTVITHEDLTVAGIDWGDIDNLINTVRLAEEADTAVIAKVHDDGRVKISLRSRGATDVGSLAAEMGGGGHRLAAGFTATGDVGALLERIQARIGAYR
jgi:bifunctional oligoribonuclease and PAP phosphatase NrnA